MASTCFKIVAPETNSSFLEFAPPATISFRRKDDAHPSISSDNVAVSSDLALDFEFRLEDPVTMLPADELFSDGKLVPLQISVVRPHVESFEAIRSPDAERPRRGTDVLGPELCAQSPKVPRCSSGWRELFGLKKPNSSMPDIEKEVPAEPSRSLSTRSLLHRHPKPSTVESSISTPLLRDSDTETVPISARRSLSSSSSSSGADHDEFSRLSLDFEKPVGGRISLARATSRVRVSRTRSISVEKHHAERTRRSPVRRRTEAAHPSRGVSADSPRMNASGKVIFQGLERSSRAAMETSLQPASVFITSGQSPSGQWRDRTRSMSKSRLCSTLSRWDLSESARPGRVPSSASGSSSPSTGKRRTSQTGGGILTAEAMPSTRPELNRTQDKQKAAFFKLKS